MNVDITPGFVDINSTSGLCGNLNGKIDDDGRTEPIPRYPSFYRLKEEHASHHRWEHFLQNEFKQRFVLFIY